MTPSIPKKTCVIVMASQETINLIVPMWIGSLSPHPLMTSSHQFCEAAISEASVRAEDSAPY